MTEEKTPCSPGAHSWLMMIPGEYTGDGEIIGRLYHCPRCTTTLLRKGELPEKPGPARVEECPLPTWWHVAGSTALIGAAWVFGLSGRALIDVAHRLTKTALNLVSGRRVHVTWQAWPAQDRPN